MPNIEIVNVNIDLSTMQNGELQKKFNEELQAVIKSFLDKDIPRAEKRSIDIKITAEMLEGEIAINSTIGSKIPKRKTKSTYLTLQQTAYSSKFTVKEKKLFKDEIQGQIGFDELFGDEEFITEEDEETVEEARERAKKVYYATVEKDKKLLGIHI